MWLFRDGLVHLGRTGSPTAYPWATSCLYRADRVGFDLTRVDGNTLALRNRNTRDSRRVSALRELVERELIAPRLSEGGAEGAR